MPVTNFFWDGDNLLQEYDDAGTTTAQYSTEPGSFGSMTSQRRSSQSHYYHYDPLGSATELTDASGNVTDTRRYKAFGETVEQSGSTTFPFQYVGQVGYYLDDERALYYIRRRDLRSVTGRWTSEDPSPLPGRYNLYEYVFNNPQNISDPSGLAPPLPCTPGTESGLTEAATCYVQGDERDSFGRVELFKGTCNQFFRYSCVGFRVLLLSPCVQIVVIPKWVIDPIDLLKSGSCDDGFGGHSPCTGLISIGWQFPNLPF